MDWRRAKGITLDAIRHALPLVPFYLRHGSVTSYLLLTAFDLSLGLMLIVGTTRDVKDPTTVDPRATWLISRLVAVVVLALFLVVVAAIISFPLGIPAFLFGAASGVHWRELVRQPGFWIPAAIMMLVTGARAQRSFESVTTVGERGTSARVAPIKGDLEADRRRSKASYAAQVTLIATYAALAYGLSIFGRRGFFVFPALYAAILVFYDARPDLGQRIFPELWREANLPETKRTTARK